MTARTMRRHAMAIGTVTCAAALVSTTALAGTARADSHTVGPIFEDGQAQVVPEFADPSAWIRQQLWVETEFDSDGDGELDRMHVDVTRPGQTEDGLKVPVVYETSPYYAGTSSLQSQYFWNVDHELGEEPPPRVSPPPIPHQDGRTSVSNSHVSTWVPRGFAVVHSDSVGTGLSEGCPTVGGPNESLAPKAVVDWLNGHATGYTSVDGDEEVSATSWSTGKVGMTGTSYNGTLPIAAASTGVDGLEAIIPIAPNTSYYHYYRSNGLVRNPGGFVGEDVDFLFDFISSGYPDTRQYCIDTIRVGEMNKFQDRSTGDYNDFWATRDYLNVVENVTAPTLMAHAFNDWNVVPEHSVRILEALEAQGTPVQSYFHQGGHGGAPPLELRNRWFTRYLYGVENEVEDDPKAWIAREGDSRFEPTPYDGYPNPEASPVGLLPQGGGTTGGLTSLTLPNQSAETLVDAGNEACNAGNLATEVSEHRLLYATPELSAPVHISGTTEVTIRLSSSKPAANLSVALVRLPWTGGAGCDSSTRFSSTSVVTRGWADPQNHSSLTDGQPLVPGQAYDVTFDLQPDDQVIPAGSQIGLMIFSTDNEFTLRPEPGTELTVDLAETSVDLPVVGGPLAMPVCETADDREAVVVGGVDSGVPNRPLAGVCTINDHILDDEPWANHGYFVEHVTDVGDQLVAGAVITHQERAAIIRAAAMSGIGASKQ